MSIHVFLGPTLPRDRAAQYLDAIYHPPIEQGDVLRALRHDPSAILIVDGRFMFVPAVWHKEILCALEQGVKVFGAASIGALRAAELADFGMVGIGKIYRSFASGALEDDDEVAVAHAHADQRFRPHSEALVNIRDVCERAVSRSLIASHTADTVTAIAKQMFYADRRWPDILDAARRQGVARDELDRLYRLHTSTRPLKERDAALALRVLARVSTQGLRPRRPPVRVEPTVFFLSLQRQVDAESSADWQQPPGGALDVARKKVLLGILASRELERGGLDAISGGMDEQVADWFHRAYEIPEGVARDVWLAARGLTRSNFDHAMRRFSAVVAIQQRLGDEIERELPAFQRLHDGARRPTVAEWVQVNVALSRRQATPVESARRLFARLRPMLTTNRRRLGLQSFHFTRKQPDVRLRFLCLRPADLLSAFEAALGKSSGVNAAYVSVYEAEARLFGGDEAMAAVHRYFEQDSINAMQWILLGGAGRRDPAPLCFHVVDDLFVRGVEGGTEAWDAWHNVLELASSARAGQTAMPRLNQRSISSADRQLLRVYRRANAALVAACHALQQEGRLAVGMRALLAYVAMFHLNRYGLDGERQQAIARAAIARHGSTGSR
jgi:thiopeptide-type bacteriocin biosynthesis protein